MTFLPIVGRELRVSARTASTYWLRLVGATALLMAGGIYWMEGDVTYGASSDWFMAMHLTLFWTIWVLVPVMTADCICRERREGTLGLLFLTPLKAGDIVLAKGFAHGLRAVTLCIAGVPVLVLPFLTGGVGWLLELSSVLINFSALCWALSAGVLVSSAARTFTRAVVGAVIVAGLFLAVLGVVHVAALIVAWQVTFPQTGAGTLLHPAFFRWFLDEGFLSITRIDDLVRSFGLSVAGSSSLQAALAGAMFSVTLFSFLSLLLIIRWAASNVRRNWQDKPRSVLQAKLEKEFCTPAYGIRLFRGWMRRLLERNPIGWLERRTWQARTVSWAWLAVIVSLYSLMLGSTRPDWNSFQEWQWIIAALFCASLTVSAAGSFRRERESGVMELLLVTPLTVGQIINGRLRGIWSQFLPSLLLFVIIQFHLISIARWVPWNRDTSMEGALLLWLLGGATLTLPVIGLYFSLRCRLHITAVVAALAVGIGVPALATMVVAFLSFVGGNPERQTLFRWLLLATMAAFVWVLIRHHTLRPLLRISSVAWLAMLAAMFVILRLDDALPAGWSIFGAGHVPLIIVATLFYALLQTGCALWLGLKLHQNLENRSFALPQ